MVHTYALKDDLVLENSAYLNCHVEVRGTFCQERIFIKMRWEIIIHIEFDSMWYAKNSIS